ncbi:Very-long-chain 3-oxoacyl-CoA reductase [Nosema granulosis]|uniref:Very-long-chain 3-oxoacyl-CoA reductase n=1 Tax=Nosema granulosis TaxID=83296 RepID=A0A9P6KYV2_9MICR|nr:Very-long-chain 3-oxoacyl-CoA reductase [Nosema granulosis]
MFFRDILFCLFLDFVFRKIPLILLNIISQGNNSSVWTKLKGKHVIITGATGDIGRELCRGLVDKDVKLIIIGRNEEQLKRLKDEMDEHIICEMFVVDFNIDSDFAFLDDYRDVGLLINNAGTLLKGPGFYLEEDDDPIINVNIRSTTKITRRVLRGMIERKFGYILNIGSVSADVPFPYLSSYAASKAFLKIWSFSLYYELKDFNIEVEYVDLAYVATKMTKLKPIIGVIPSNKIIAKNILSSFGSTYHLIPYTTHLILICIISYIPICVLGRIIEYVHRVYNLNQRHEDRRTRSRQVLTKRN